MLRLCSFCNRQTNGYGASAERHEHGNTAVLVGVHVLVPLFLSQIPQIGLGLNPNLHCGRSSANRLSPWHVSVFSGSTKQYTAYCFTVCSEVVWCRCTLVVATQTKELSQFYCTRSPQQALLQSDYRHERRNTVRCESRKREPPLKRHYVHFIHTVLRINTLVTPNEPVVNNEKQIGEEIKRKHAGNVSVRSVRTPSSNKQGD
jgi:hypothetical protein